MESKSRFIPDPGCDDGSDSLFCDEDSKYPDKRYLDYMVNNLDQNENVVLKFNTQQILVYEDEDSSKAAYNVPSEFIPEVSKDENGKTYETICASYQMAHYPVKARNVNNEWR